MRKLNKITALLLACLMLPIFSVFTGCRKETGFSVPENMNREQAALFTAIAAVCPKNENHSKAQYLSFFIEGWSFDSFPAEILNYLNDYCANGKASFIQLSYNDLKDAGYIVPGDGGFYSEDEETYMLGKGKMFTFIKAGDENSDTMTVKLKTFVSDSDSSGYDIELKFEKNAWKVERFSNPWGGAYMDTSEPETGSSAPQK